MSSAKIPSDSNAIIDTDNVNYNDNVKVETNIDAQTVVKNEAIIDAQTVVKDETNIDAQTVVKDETNIDTQTVVKNETNIDAQTVIKGETNIDSQTVVKAEANIDVQAVVKEETNIDVQIVAKDETNTDSQTVVSDNEQPIVKLGTLDLLLVMLGLSFATFLAALDQTIVAPSLPAIASDLKALDKISLVGTSYLVTTTSFQPIYGKFSDIFGRKATFLFAIIMFELGSLLCGLAPNISAMIIFRAIAGVGGAGIIGLVMIIISDIVTLQDRGKYQGIIVGIFGLASIVGPIIGGAFTDHVTWRWSFYINLPLGAVTIVIVVTKLYIPYPRGSLLQKLKRIDYAGTIAVIGATVALLLSLNWGGNEYKWNSPIIITLFVVGFIGYLLFALIETKFAFEPVAPPHLFKRLDIIGCYSTNFFQGMTFFAIIYYVPIYFQVVKGDTAMESGLELVPCFAGLVIAANATGQMVSRTEMMTYRTICAIGAALITSGGGLISLWDENTGRAAQIGYMFIVGVGVGAIIQTALICAQGIVEYKDIATITTLLMFFKLLGAVFGVAVAGTIFTNALINNLEEASIPPEYFEAAKHSATIVNKLPIEIRKPIITAYVNSLRNSIFSVVPLGILCFICTILMGNNKPKIDKMTKDETIVNLE